jgi:hypothetical protein
MSVVRRRRAGAVLALSCAGLLALALPARADRWFGSVQVDCESFGVCAVFPAMPDPPGDPASIQLDRTGKADAPLEIFVRVNKPVEGGVPVRLTFGETVFDLQPGIDVLTRRDTRHDRVLGYWIAEARVAEVLAAMRRVDTGRLRITIAGQSEPQDRLVQLDGLDAALRYLDERQGRAGAQDAVLDKGPRAAADTPAPKPLPKMAEWPAQVVRIFKRENCEKTFWVFDEMTAGSIAAVAGGRELWQVACAGSNYNVHFIFLEIRNGDPKTARALTFPTRLHKRRDGVVTNPVWWTARQELWAFERHHSHGDCGVVARYRWEPGGFKLIDQRRKEDCDSRFTDPWTTWPVVKAKRGR